MQMGIGILIGVVVVVGLIYGGYRLYKRIKP
jgi:hypothetical protein